MTPAVDCRRDAHSTDSPSASFAMDARKSPEQRDEPSPPAIVRVIDRIVVALIHLLIAGAHLRSRDPNERFANLFEADPRETTRIRNWQGVLRWSPQKRVGCFAGVLIGVVIGGAILWFGVR